MTDDRKMLEARLAELEEAQRAAPGWGAAVGATAEEIREVKGKLSALDREARAQAGEPVASKWAALDESIVSIKANHAAYVSAIAELEHAVMTILVNVRRTPACTADELDKWWYETQLPRIKKIYTHPAPAQEPVMVPAGEDDWREDPAADERWNAGCDYAMEQLCAVLGVERESIQWDAATETVDGDVQAVLRNILDAGLGDNWQRLSAAPVSPPAESGEVERMRAALETIKAASVDGWFAKVAGDALASTPAPQPVMIGVDLASGPDYTAWLCPECKRPVVTPAPQPGGAVKVKALEWEDGYSFCAPVNAGFYRVAFRSGAQHWALTGHGMPEPPTSEHTSEDAAKAAAQADYERRILSALSPSPSGWDAGELREACAQAAEAKAMAEAAAASDDRWYRGYAAGRREAGLWDWVPCPICNEPDMARETDAEGRSLIRCVNLGCPSNGAAPERDVRAALDAAKSVLETIAKNGAKFGPIYSHAMQALHQLRAVEANPLPGAPQPGEEEDCRNCAGNGEIVTDWDRYLKAHPGDVGDEAVAECPECSGTGKVDVSPQPGGGWPRYDPNTKDQPFDLAEVKITARDGTERRAYVDRVRGVVMETAPSPSGWDAGAEETVAIYLAGLFGEAVAPRHRQWAAELLGRIRALPLPTPPAGEG